MDVIADLPAYPQWSDGMESVQVLEANPDGTPLVAHFDFASGPLKDDFVLRYDWHGTDYVAWTMTEGKVLRRQEGRYTLTPNADGTVTVTYDLVVELSVPMIGALKRKAEKKIVRSALAGLKQRVESLT